MPFGSVEIIFRWLDCCLWKVWKVVKVVEEDGLPVNDMGLGWLADFSLNSFKPFCFRITYLTKE